MKNFSELAAQVSRALGRDNQRKTAIMNANAEIFFGGAFDSKELGMMSAHEAGAEVLKKRGVSLLSGEDGARALELFDAGMMYGAGVRSRNGGAFAADASEGASFIDRYLGDAK